MSQNSKKKYVNRDVYNNPLLKSARNRKEHEKWDNILKKQGLEAIDADKRVTKEYSSRRSFSDADDRQGRRNLEYYSVYKAYCENYNYDIKTVVKIKEIIGGRKRNTRSAFKKMLRMYVNGLSMPNSYRAIAAHYSYNLNSAVFFYKRFQEANAEFLAAYPKFSSYLEYVKYELGEPLSFEVWAKLQ